MKKLILFLIVMVAFTGVASAQYLTGVGLGVIVDTGQYNADFLGTNENTHTFTGIGLNVFFASDNGFGFFADATLALMLNWNQKYVVDGITVGEEDVPIDDLETTTMVNVLIGPGYTMDMGMMKLHFGVGAHLGIWYLSDGYDDFSAVNVGAGATASIILNTGMMKLRIGLDVSYDFLPLANDIYDSYEELYGDALEYGAVVIAPSVSVIF